MAEKDIFTMLVSTFPDIKEVHDTLEDTPTVFLPVAVGGYLETRVKDLILMRLVERGATTKFVTKNLDYVQAVDLAAALGMFGDKDESVKELVDDFKIIAELRNIHAHRWSVPLDDVKAQDAMVNVVRRLYKWTFGLPQPTPKQMQAKLEAYKEESLGRDAPFRGGLLVYALFLAVALNKMEEAAKDKRLDSL